MTHPTHPAAGSTTDHNETHEKRQYDDTQEDPTKRQRRRRRRRRRRSLSSSSLSSSAGDRSCDSSVKKRDDSIGSKKTKKYDHDRTSWTGKRKEQRRMSDGDDDDVDDDNDDSNNQPKKQRDRSHSRSRSSSKRRRKKKHGDSSDSEDSSLPSSSSMMIGFQKSVEEVAKQVRRSMMMEELVVPVANQQNRRHPTTTVGPCPAISGRYRCIIHVQQIYQFQKAILPVVAPTTSSIDLIFTSDEEDQSGLGWDIHGSHQMDSSASPVLSGGEWRLEEGHLSPTGEAYWVEKDPSGTNLLLVHGTFHTHGPSSPCHTAFQGEWLTSNGDRGRFSDVVHEPELESSSHSQLKQQEEVYPGTPSKEVFIAVPVPNIPNMRTTVNGR